VTGVASATRRGASPLRWAAWVVLAVVVGVALALGASRGTAAQTPSQRAGAIDAQVRCPSCEGISVQASSASTAQAIRVAVAARVRAGQSDRQIFDFLVSRYGPGILLRPPAGGATAWVWVLPPLAVGAAASGLGVVFWRRRRTETSRVTVEDRLLVERALAERAASEPARPERARPARSRPGRRPAEHGAR